MPRLILTLALLLAAASPAPAAEGWVLQRGDGAPATLGDLGKALRASDVVFFGEQHDDEAGHRFEAALLELALREARPERTVTLSLEMFERDVQGVLDEYLQGFVREEDFLAASRPWPNYKSAYRPLVELAKAEKLRVLASNVPKRYASRAARLGLAALVPAPASARAWLPPLPVPPPSAAFAARFEAFLDQAQGHGAPHMAEAQVLRDAAMAHAIAEHARLHPRALVLHLNGAFHSEGGLGTPEMLSRYAPGLKRLVVTMNPEGATGNDFILKTRAR